MRWCLVVVTRERRLEQASLSSEEARPSLEVRTGTLNYQDTPIPLLVKSA
jgi:hypothetical protein